MASDDAAVLLKWMTDMRGLEFYEGRDKRYTPELIQEDFFEEDEENGGNGFGYDPVFYLPERGCTTAQLEPEEKNKISHRGQALRKMYEILKKENVI